MRRPKLYLIYCIDEAAIKTAGPFSTARARTLAARAIIRSYGARSVVMARLDQRGALGVPQEIPTDECESWYA